MVKVRVGLVAALSLLVLATGATGCNGKDVTGPAGDSGGPVVGVYVNELMAANKSILQDESGAFPDWIELYNETDQPFDPSGYWLTDDATNPTKFQFTAGLDAIAPHGWLILYADSDIADGPLHLSFELDAAGGEDVALFGPGGSALVDAVLDLPLAVDDQAYARVPDGGPWQRVSTPTPGEANQP